MQIALIAVLFMVSSVFAQQCIKGNPINRAFQNDLLRSNEALVKEFREAVGITTTTGQVGCFTCSQSSAKNVSTNNLKIHSQISQNCVEGALQRKIKQKSVVCSGNLPFSASGSNSVAGPCVNKDIAGYITHVSNKVLACFNNLEIKPGRIVPIEPKTFFSKINNESGFNFSPSYVGGVGIGQLTSPAVKEMNVLDSGKSGNGRFILDALLRSQKPECSGLKEIIKDDKVKRFTNPRRPVCEWVSLNRGLPRNLIYSVGYFTYIKNSLIQEMEKRNIKIDDATLDKMALVSYYRGPAKGKTYLRDWKRSPMAANQVRSELDNEIYIKAINKKINEVKGKTGGTCELT